MFTFFFSDSHFYLRDLSAVLESLRCSEFGFWGLFLHQLFLILVNRLWCPFSPFPITERVRHCRWFSGSEKDEQPTFPQKTLSARSSGATLGSAHEQPTYPWQTLTARSSGATLESPMNCKHCYDFLFSPLSVPLFAYLFLCSHSVLGKSFACRV